MYMIRDGKPVQVDILTGAAWLENDDNRHLAENFIGDIRVSTVFLGIDHNYSRQGPPVLWETMAFRSGEAIDRQDRYTSEEAAWAGHEAFCQWVRDGMPQ